MSAIPGSPAARTFVAASMLLMLFLLLGAGETRAGDSEAARVEGPTLLKDSKRTKRLERRVRGCTNRKRIKRGLPTLEPAKPLERAASLHANSMSKDNFFDHIDRKGRDAADRVGLFGSKSRYQPIGENLAAGDLGAREVCKAWMKSSTHRANILDPGYEVIGVGYERGGDYGSYYVQVFGR